MKNNYSGGISMKGLSFILGLCLHIYLQAAEKPNIVIIMADDISPREFPIYSDHALSKDPRTRTPMLDRMALDGVAVSTCWASPQCKPTRAILHTGRYPMRTGVWENSIWGRFENGPFMIRVQTEKKKSIDGFLRIPTAKMTPYITAQYHGKLGDVSKGTPLTIGHIARYAGYSTQWVSKWHTGGTPSHFGFDEGHIVNEPFYWGGSELMTWSKAGENPKESKGDTKSFEPDNEVEVIADFMERKAREKKPFLVLYTPHLGHQDLDVTNVHGLGPENNTWVGTPKLTIGPDGYLEKVKKDTRRSDTTQITDFGRDVDFGEDAGGRLNRGIGSHIEYLDFNISRLIKKLEQLGVMENTVVMFLTDNGTKEYGKIQKERELGPDVPFYIYAPGRLDVRKTGKVLRQNAQPKTLAARGQLEMIMTVADVLPTVAELSGFRVPSDHRIDGVSLWPYLSGVSSVPPHRAIYSAHAKNYFSEWLRSPFLIMDGNGDWWDTRDPNTGKTVAEANDAWHDKNEESFYKKLNNKRSGSGLAFNGQGLDGELQKQVEDIKALHQSLWGANADGSRGGVYDLDIK